MNFGRLFLAALCVLSLLTANVQAKDTIPMQQGIHQWPALNGKLILVVGTYQDSVTFRRTYNFYFKEAKDEIWNQVPLLNKAARPQSDWYSASGGEVTLADGVVSSRSDGVYFIVADKRADQGYYEKGEFTVTWYKLVQSSDDRPDDSPYLLKPVFTRNYPKSASTVEAILAKETALQPRK